jgi:hypothetical protein
VNDSIWTECENNSAADVDVDVTDCPSKSCMSLGRCDVVSGIRRGQIAVDDN